MVKRFDMHVHTEESSDSIAKPSKIVEKALEKGLDGIAVTDHDSMYYVEEVEKAAENTDLKVIPGVEVTTTEGHILGWFLDSVPESKEPLQVIEEIHDQDGVACLAHPFDFLRQRFKTEEVFKKADVIETVNSRCVTPFFNKNALKKANNLGKPVSGGSDAHFPFELSRAYTEIEDDQNLREALESGRTKARGRGMYFVGHAFTKTVDLARVLGWIK